MEKKTEVKANEWVEVKGPLEIAQTLDADGTLDGVPFMPEMLEHCGKRYRVLRRAEKTCVELPGGVYAIREFTNNDVFLLDGLRCSGASHDGCQRGCMFFWKSAWLKGSVDAPKATPHSQDLAILASRLKTKISAIDTSANLRNSAHPRSLDVSENWNCSLNVGATSAPGQWPPGICSFWC